MSAERWQTEVNKMLMMMMVTTLVTMLNKIKIFLDAGGRDGVWHNKPRVWQSRAEEGKAKKQGGVYIRVFQMWHFVKKKLQCQYNSLQGIYKPNQKNFFPRTSLEGHPTWSKMVKIDQNRRGGGITVPQIYVAHYATAA